MTGSFSVLVAEYTHTIGAEIDSARRRRLLLEQLKAVTMVVVDGAGAEEVGLGSRIFADPGAPVVDWYVLAHRKIEDAPMTSLLSLVGVIPGVAEPGDFVAQAYLHVLRRPVDEAGLENYRSRLASGAITRRSLLRSLASSGEAQDKGISVTILPETSFWLTTRDKNG